MSSKEDVIASIKVMRMQEESAYALTPDFLHQQLSTTNAMRGPINTKGLPVDAECRYKMAEWKHQVVDFCKFQRETVAISMSYLDRFLASPGGVEAKQNRRIFQLAAMAALYTSIKIFEPEAVDPATVAGLSRGAHSAEQVEDMERQILSAIEWRLHPPTALAFCRMFLDVLPAVDSDVREAALEIAKFQTELAVSDYYFVGINPSTIAFAAIVNAFQSLKIRVDIQALKDLAIASGIILSSKQLLEVKEKLFESVVKTSVSPTITTTQSTATKNIETNRVSDGHVSPRGVLQATTNY